MIDFNFTSPQSVWTPKLSRPRSDPKRMDYPFLTCGCLFSDNSHYLTYGKTDREKIFITSIQLRGRRILEAAASLQGDEVSSLSVSEVTKKPI